MILLQRSLFLMLVIILIYTAIAIANQGFGLIPVFLGNIIAMGWSGQFNLDFLMYLLLSALWVAWRGGFTGQSIALGLAASVLGMCFLAPYLLVVLRRTKDIEVLLLGVNARSGPAQ